MTRQRTRWRHETWMKTGPLVRTGRIHNAPVVADVVRMQIWDAEGESACDVSMTIDEAVHIASALMRMVAKEMTTDLSHAVRDYYDNRT